VPRTRGDGSVDHRASHGRRTTDLPGPPHTTSGSPQHCSSSSKANRKYLRGKGIKAVIPEKADQAANRKRKGRAGGRPPAFDTESYKGRNVVERAFNKAKQWRAIATRYDKLAITYRAGFVLALCVEWLKLLGDTP
jgi:transposase